MDPCVVPGGRTGKEGKTDGIPQNLFLRDEIKRRDRLCHLQLLRSVITAGSQHRLASCSSCPYNRDQFFSLLIRHHQAEHTQKFDLDMTVGSSSCFFCRVSYFVMEGNFLLYHLSIDTKRTISMMSIDFNLMP